MRGIGAGIYVTHPRDYGSGLADASEEALEIGGRAGIPVHFSHFHVSGPGREGWAGEFLAPIEAARGSGQRVTLDVCPYTTGRTTLTAFLPDRLKTRPTAAPIGIAHVLVNARFVVRDSTVTGDLPGRVLYPVWKRSK